jgi:hypothetical protein
MRLAPTKHVSEHTSLLGLAGRVLSELRDPCTVSELWRRVRARRDPVTFARFVLALDLLHLIGVASLEHGLVTRDSR